jgi:hypothetical protein
MDPDVVWAHIQLLNAVGQQEQAAATVVVTNQRYLLVRMLIDRPQFFVYVVVNAIGIGLGEARAHLEQAVVNDAPILETNPPD